MITGESDAIRNWSSCRGI